MAMGGSASLNGYGATLDAVVDDRKVLQLLFVVVVQLNKFTWRMSILR